LSLPSRRASTKRDADMVFFSPNDARGKAHAVARDLKYKPGWNGAFVA
jgi:hypothetical protein